ncbi:DUF3540 domain-containing protein [Desulfonatronum parangueonense]
MHNAVAVEINREVRPLALSHGRISGRVEERFRVETDTGYSLWARRADGCLLEPAMDDLVLVAAGGGTEAFILSVLIKRGKQSTMVLPGEATIQADGISLTARESLSMQAPSVELAGVNGRVGFLDLRLQAGSCRAEIQKASVVVRFLDSVMERVTQRVKNCFRTVEDTESLDAGRIRTRVSQRCSLKAKHVSLQAEEEVVMDGKRIHIG